MPFSPLYRRLFEKKKEVYRRKLFHALEHMFINLNPDLRYQFMHQLVYAILQHQPTDDIHHYLSDVSAETFLPILKHLLNYGLLDTMCLDSCVQFVLGRSVRQCPH